eukprot:TRINITY_DN30773_c0_g1_i1.p1 TRINITY_DN30773_c0_g1~~TRINITY_DN30773_c0_g1_i1.p1  ORF type:complete len:773 (+),score=106.43 TRINITY_DN30773_c0_g1_i1:76-2394(+)
MASFAVVPASPSQTEEGRRGSKRKGSKSSEDGEMAQRLQEALGLVRGKVGVDATALQAQKAREEELRRLDDWLVPKELTWLLFRQAQLQRYGWRLMLHGLLLVLFIVVVAMLHPVESTFTAQSSILAATGSQRSASLLTPSAAQGMFFELRSREAWWHWMSDKLIPTVLAESFYNGDSRLDSRGSRLAHTVGSYNTLTSSVRVRQARVRSSTSGCATGVAVDDTGPPECLPEFSAGEQSLEPHGGTYGTEVLDNLNEVVSWYTPLRRYGTSGHILDLPVNQSSALGVIQTMKSGGWFDEQSRMVAVETTWYNPNIDLSSYARWQLEVSPGGRWVPSVHVSSCRLVPYSSTRDFGRAVLEIACLLLLLALAVDLVQDALITKLTCFTTLWTYVELATLALYALAVSWWIAFVLSDKRDFQAATRTQYHERPQLFMLTAHFDALVKLAATCIACSCLQVFRCLQVTDAFDLVWRTLEAALSDLVHMMVVFLMVITFYSLAAHFVFGHGLEAFSTWPRSFLTLLLSMVLGLPLDDLRGVSEVSSMVLVVTWCLTVGLMLLGMFVAVVCEWRRQVSANVEFEQSRLAQRVYLARRVDWYSWLRRTLATFSTAGDDEEATPGAKDEDCLEAVLADCGKLLQRADLHAIHYLREAVRNRAAEVPVALLRRHFGGDVQLTRKFASKLQTLHELDTAALSLGDKVVEFGDAADREALEMSKLKNLQEKCLSMSKQIQTLRCALHHSGSAALLPGQSSTGYYLRAIEGFGAMGAEVTAGSL